MFGTGIINWKNSQAYLATPQSFWLWALAVARIPELIVMGRERLTVSMLVSESLHD